MHFNIHYNIFSSTFVNINLNNELRFQQTEVIMHCEIITIDMKYHSLYFLILQQIKTLKLTFSSVAFYYIIKTCPYIQFF